MAKFKQNRRRGVILGICHPQRLQLEVASEEHNQLYGGTQSLQPEDFDYTFFSFVPLGCKDITYDNRLARQAIS